MTRPRLNYVKDVRPSLIRTLAGSVDCTNKLCFAKAGEPCVNIKNFHAERLLSAYQKLKPRLTMNDLMNSYFPSQGILLIKSKEEEEEV